MSVIQGQTTITYGKLKARVKGEDPKYKSPDIDFDTALGISLPKFASQTYTGKFYNVPSQASSPQAFSPAYQTTDLGDWYEESLPDDCINDGIETLKIWDGGHEVLYPATVKTEDKSTWDTSVEGVIPWRCQGRKLECFIPASIGASTPILYSIGYQRVPEVAPADGDPLDLPVEGFDDFYTAFKEEIQVI